MVYKPTYEDVDEPLENLAAAVIKQACDDYRAACRVEVRRRKRDPAITTKRKLYRHMVGKDDMHQVYGYIPLPPKYIKECERFFESEDAYFFTDVDLRIIAREIRRRVGLER